ncbi:hypothetical protein S83_045712 [Arachis hypogaea]
MYLDWWFRVACRFFSHDRLLVDPHQGGIPADAPVRDHITALARQQEPNVPDNRCRITCEHVGTRYSQPMVTGFEDVLVLDEEQDIDDDDDDDGSNGGGGIGGGGFDWGWGGGSSGSGGGVSGSSYGVGGGNTRWGGAGGFVGPRGEGAGGLHLVVVPRVGGGSSQVETSTLFSDFGSPRQMGQVFGAGSDFLPRLPNLSAQQPKPSTNNFFAISVIDSVSSLIVDMWIYRTEIMCVSNSATGDGGLRWDLHGAIPARSPVASAGSWTALAGVLDGD